MLNKKRILVSLVLVGLMVMAVSSLAWGQEITTIRMWTFLNPSGSSGREVALRQIIDSFEEENPGIKVVVEPQQWDVMTPKFLAAHLVGNAPDIIWVLDDDLGAALELNALADFESLFLSEWTEEDIQDVDDVFWRLGNKDGKHYQVTLSRNYISIIYRKDLLEAKGIEVPIRTWDDLIAAAKELTEVDPETGIKRWGLGQAFATEQADPPLIVPCILNEQPSLFTEDGQAKWATEPGIRALEMLRDMILVHGITPESAITSSVEDMYQEFCAGKYAMIIGAGVRIEALRNQATFDGSVIDMMLWPTWDGEGHSPGVVKGWHVGVWSQSEHKQEAGKFVEYMFNEESDRLWVTLGGQVPVRKSTILREPEFFNDPANDYLRTMAEGFSDYGFAQPWEYRIRGWKLDLNNAVQAVVVENTPAEEALKNAELEFNRRNQR